MRIAQVSIALLLLAVSPGLTGCDTLGRDVGKDAGTPAQILTEDGSVPDEFPNDVPLYEGRITRAFTSNDNMTVAIETSDQAARVYEWCLEEIADEGWEITASYETDDGGTIAADKGDRSLQYTITTRDEGSGMVVFTGPKAE